MRRAFDVLMRLFSSFLGLVVVGLGSIWMMQGLGVGPAFIMQGFMVNDLHWTLYGALLAAVGVAQIVWTNTRRPG